jgi:hypothetical protein
MLTSSWVTAASDGGQRIRQPTEKPYIRARYAARVNARPRMAMRPALGEWSLSRRSAPRRRTASARGTAVDNSKCRGYNATPASRKFTASRLNRSISFWPISLAFRTAIPGVDRLPPRLRARADAPAIRDLDPATVVRRRVRAAPVDRAQPVRAAVGQGSFWRPDRDARPAGDRRADGRRVRRRRRGVAGGQDLDAGRCFATTGDRRQCAR